jgi:predicted XRE-type DNA-binding protein
VSNNKNVTASSGNVFADLGFANPEEELLKAKLVRELRGIIKRRKLTQNKAAAMLGLKQPDVAALVTASFRSIVWFGAWIDWTTRLTSLCAKSRAGLPREQLPRRAVTHPFGERRPQRCCCKSVIWPRPPQAMRAWAA